MAEKQQYEQIVKRMGGVLMVEVEQDESGTKLDVIAHAEAVKGMTKQVYLEALHNLIDRELGEIVGINLIPVKVQSGLDVMKQELEEVEGILGVYISPTQWDEENRVKEVQFVINVDENKFDDFVFQDRFKRIAREQDIRVKMKVSFVLYRPKQTGIIL